MEHTDTFATSLCNEKNMFFELTQMGTYVMCYISSNFSKMVHINQWIIQ